MLKEFDKIDDYIKEKKFRHEKTQQAYRRSLMRFIDFIENSSPDFKRLTFDNLIKEFDIDLKKNNYADSTRFFTLKVVINYFKYLSQEGISDVFGISINKVFDKSEKDLDKISEKSIISIDEKIKLFECVRAYNDYLNLFLFMIAFYCGLKTQHLCNIKFSDFINVNGKLYYDNRLYEKHPVMIGLPEEVREVYLRILPRKPREFIFITESGKDYYARYVNRVFKFYCNKAGINHYSPMDFRHSSVYYYVKENGIDIQKIQYRYNWYGDNLKRLYGDLLGIK